MSSNNTTFLAVGTGDEARRIAVIKTAGRSQNESSPPSNEINGQGVFWLSGFNSTMSGTKASDLAAWAEARGVGMTRFDYSGHGQSSGQFEDGTISAWLEEANAVLMKATTGSQVLVGSSMGGWIALLMAEALNRKTPGRIAGVVLIAPAWDMTERLMWKPVPQDIRDTILRDGVWYRPSEYDDNNYPITLKLIEDGRNHLFGARPIDTGCSVRILHGLEDPDVPWQGSETLVRNLVTNDAHLTLIKGAGHRLSEPADIVLLKQAVADLLQE